MNEKEITEATTHIETDLIHKLANLLDTRFAFCALDSFDLARVIPITMNLV